MPLSSSELCYYWTVGYMQEKSLRGLGKEITESECSTLAQQRKDSVNRYLYNVASALTNPEVVKGESPSDLLDALSDQPHHSLSVFGRLPYRLLASLHTKSGRYLMKASAHRRFRLEELDYTFQRLALQIGTSWFKRLKLVNQIKVTRLLEQRKYDKLKSILSSTDGIVYKIILTSRLPVSLEEVEALQVSIISNLLGNTYVYLKKLKVFYQSVKKNLLDSNAEVQWLKGREYSRIMKYFKRVDTRDNTKIGVYRRILLCQTRCTGIVVDPESTALKEFEDIIRNDSPSPKCDWFYSTMADIFRSVSAESFDNCLRSLKVTVTDNGSTESPAAQGGKSALYRAMLADDRLNSLTIDYETGIIGTVTGESTVGDRLLASAVTLLRDAELREKFLNDHGFNATDPHEIHVTTVVEAGLKERIVTTTSAIAAVPLQVVSHLLIDILSGFYELEVGLRHSRNGFEAVRRMKPENPRASFIFNSSHPEGRLYAYSTDRSTATDYASRARARDFIRAAVDTGVLPGWIGEVALEYWCGDDIVTFPNGKTYTAHHRMVPMGKPITKAFLSACNLSAIWKVSGYSRTFAQFNGDDAMLVVEHQLTIGAFENRMSDLGFVRSEKDTGTTDGLINYCEEWFYVPKRSIFAINHLNYDSNYGAYPYLDYPRIRLLLDVSRVHGRESDSPIGRWELLAKEISWSQPTSPMYWQQGLLYLLQDCSNSRFRGFRTMYLPRALGGAGRWPSFLRYKSVSNFYSEELAELRRPMYYTLNAWGTWMTNFSTTGESKMPTYLESLRGTRLLNNHSYCDSRDYFISLDDTSGLVVRDVLVDYIIRENPTLVERDALSSLNRMGYVITGRDLLQVMMVTHECASLLGVAERNQIRQKNPDRVLEKLYTGPSGDTAVTLDPFLSSLTLSGHLYLDDVWLEATCLRDLFSRETFSLFLSRGNGVRYVHERDAKDEDEALARKLLSWLKDGIGEMPTDLIRDDAVLLQRALEFTRSSEKRNLSVILYSNDYRLGRDIYKSCNQCPGKSVTVITADPLQYLFGDTESVVSLASEPLLELVDTGSQNATMFSRFENGEMLDYELHSVFRFTDREPTEARVNLTSMYREPRVLRSRKLFY